MHPWGQADMAWAPTRFCSQKMSPCSVALSPTYLQCCSALRHQRLTSTCTGMFNRQDKPDTVHAEQSKAWPRPQPHLNQWQHDPQLPQPRHLVAILDASLPLPTSNPSAGVSGSSACKQTRSMKHLTSTPGLLGPSPSFLPGLRGDLPTGLPLPPLWAPHSDHSVSTSCAGPCREVSEGSLTHFKYNQTPLPPTWPQGTAPPHLPPASSLPGPQHTGVPTVL